MKIQTITITDRTDKTAVVEVLIADDREETPGREYVKFRMAIPSDPVANVPQLEYVALRSAREIIASMMEATKAILRENNMDVPRG